jgi:RNA polymerase-binding transcription factor DksA
MRTARFEFMGGIIATPATRANPFPERFHRFTPKNRMGKNLFLLHPAMTARKNGRHFFGHPRIGGRSAGNLFHLGIMAKKTVPAKAKPAAKAKLAAKATPAVKAKPAAKAKPAPKAKSVAKSKPPAKAKAPAKAKPSAKAKAPAKAKPAGKGKPAPKSKAPALAAKKSVSAVSKKPAPAKGGKSSSKTAPAKASPLKPTSKVPPKSVPLPAKKNAATAPSKPASKSNLKTPAKPVAKSEPKPAAKAKPAAKPEAKIPAKPAAKVAGKPEIVKPAPKAKEKPEAPAKAVVAPAKPAPAPKVVATPKAEAPVPAQPAPAKVSPTKASDRKSADAGKSVKLKLKLKTRPGAVVRPRPTALKAKAPVPEPPPPPVLKTTLPAAFIKQQKQILLDLRDTLINSMDGLAKNNLRGDGTNETASAFGMHQADAGSDAYDRDFALSLLSQEQDALYEIEEAIKRIEAGSYGMCEMSYKAIPVVRLEAIPFARYTVECQEIIEKERKMNGSTFRGSRPVFGVTEEGEENQETPVEED